jgi:hypothetical protein
MIDFLRTRWYTSSMMKGSTMTIIFCSLFLQGCATVEAPLNAIPWLETQEEIDAARETIGLKHPQHYKEKRILDAHND